MWAKVDTCFSLIKPTKQEILYFVRPVRPRFCAKNNFVIFHKANIAKLMANVKKRLKGASFGADFLYDENIDYAEKKKLKVATLNGPPSV